LFGILAAVILLIVYGSFYPWQFIDRHLTASPLYILLHSWDTGRWNRRFVADVTINLAIYIPLGMSAYLALRRYRMRWLELAGPVLLGTVLSAAVEMGQLYTPNRDCSAVDLANNAIGSALGVLAGLAFVHLVRIPESLRGRFAARNQGAVALLYCWLAYLLFPLFPVLWLYVGRAKLAGFLHAPAVSPIPTLLRAAEWLAVGRLLRAAGVRRPLRWLMVALALLPLQFGIMSRNPVPADFIGAALGIAAFHYLGKGKKADATGAAALLTAVTLTGLAPFHFRGQTQEFAWTPFIGLLRNDWQIALQILLRKLFDYGATIWLLRRVGMRLLYATCLTTAVLTGIEAAQTFFPQHVPEITDPLLAILLGFALAALNRQENVAPVELRATILRET
jgi:VanZ family protein